MSHSWWCSDDVSDVTNHGSVYVMNMQLHASRQRDWWQQYANAKSFTNFCKCLQHLFYFTCADSFMLSTLIVAVKSRVFQLLMK